MARTPVKQSSAGGLAAEGRAWRLRHEAHLRGLGRKQDFLTDALEVRLCAQAGR